MILPTMNDDDKGYEVFRMLTTLGDLHKDVKPEVARKFANGTRFPYFQRYTFTDDKMNKWFVVYGCLSKEHKKKGVYISFSYITYDVPRKHKQYDVNAGRGVLLFDHVQMKCWHDNKLTGNEKPSPIMDIVPHAINRYTERYLKPKGMENMEFGRKVESIMSRWMHFDICADKMGDTSAAKHMNGSICPYDVYMKGGGMLRGQVMNDMFIRFFTYISDDMMFDLQKEIQKDMTKEHYQWVRKGLKLG